MLFGKLLKTLFACLFIWFFMKWDLWHEVLDWEAFNNCPIFVWYRNFRLVVEKVEDFDNNTKICSMESRQEEVQYIHQCNLNTWGNIFLKVNREKIVYDFEMIHLIFFEWTHQFRKQSSAWDFYQAIVQ